MNEETRENEEEDLGMCPLCGSPLKRCKIDQYGSVLICTGDSCSTHPVFKDEHPPLRLVTIDTILEVIEDRRGW